MIPQPRWSADLSTAIVENQRAEQQLWRVVEQQEQILIDAEVRATRRAMARAARRRGGGDAVLLDEDFLAIADRPALYGAILNAALTTGGADRADLQIYDPHARALRIVAHRGFSSEFLSFFDTIAVGQPTACATALGTRRPALVDDVSHSGIFANQPTLERMLDAGSPAVYSYPLLTPSGEVAGVLSFHHLRPTASQARAELVAQTAAQALVRMS